MNEEVVHNEEVTDINSRREIYSSRPIRSIVHVRGSSQTCNTSITSILLHELMIKYGKDKLPEGRYVLEYFPVIGREKQ